ncbi:hypothetical protein [Paracnuella aquatica]|uniref:alpha-2-macroglobulin family protein n=1 Tax=Paracnuella aquatica TaxID=2268757 RepID=UPI000F4E5702|nr:hypothetical protein [Paracnuella aquatica]RPD49162.1 hypothetical protein DRJ53_08595 [Paracnuella aquatica]
MRCSTFCCAILFLFLSATVTAQSLVLRSAVPQFLRPGDRMELLLHVKNNSNKEVTGQSELQLQDATSGTAVDGWFQNFFPNQYFTASPADSATVRFPVEVPYTFFKTARLRYVASAAADTATVNALVPVLPNRQLHTQSAVHKGSGTFSIPQLVNSGENESLQQAALQVQMAATPAPFAYAALGHLLQQENPGAEAAANRLFAAGILMQFVGQQPEAANAMAKEINLQAFELVYLRQQFTAALHTLQLTQQASGGFAAWRGSNTDATTTHTVAITLARLIHRSAIPAAQHSAINNMTKNAVRFLIKSKAELSAISLAYLESLLQPADKKFSNAINISATLGRESLGTQAMMAMVLWRRGDTAQAKNVLMLALQQQKPSAPSLDNRHQLASETSLLLGAATLVNNRKAADSLILPLLQTGNPDGWQNPSATTGAAYALLVNNAHLVQLQPTSVQMGNLPPRTLPANAYFYTTTVDAGLVHPAAGNITVGKTGGASMPITVAYWQYFDEYVDPVNGVDLQREIFLCKGGKKTPWSEGIPVLLGDTMEVKLQVTNDQERTGLQLQSGWPAGFAPLGTTSINASIFEQNMLGAKRWWLTKLPAGRTTFTYRIKAAHRGTFHSGITELTEMRTGKALARQGIVKMEIE